MKDRTKIRTGKRIMAVLLSFVMVFGIFSGMKLDAEAAGTMYPFDDLQVGKELYFGDTINFESKELDNPQMSLILMEFIVPVSYLKTGNLPILFLHGVMIKYIQSIKL